MVVKLITPPAAEPVTLAEAKMHLRLELDDHTEDDLIISYIRVAREWCEGFQNRAYLTQEWEAILDRFPVANVIELPRPPLQSVTSVKYIDSAGSETTLGADVDYVVDADAEPGRIFPPAGKSWPSFNPQPYGAVRIRFVAGYETAAEVPARVMQSILLLVGHWYEHREAVLTGTISKEIEFAVQSLLRLDRVVPA